MKKFLGLSLTVVLAFATIAASAQAFSGRKVKKVTTESAAAMAGLVKEKKVASTVNFPVAPQSESVCNVPAKTATTSGPRRVTPVITEAPEGTVVYYERSGMCYNRSGSSIRQSAQDGLMTIVYADNNEVYLLEPVSPVSTGAYVKGTIDGNTITVNLPQTVYLTGQGYNLELAWVNIVNVSTSDLADRETTTATYTIDGNTISLDGSDSTHVLGYVWDDDDTWYGAGDWNSVYTETVPEEPLTPPAGIAPVTYYYNGKAYYSSASHAFSSTVNVIKDGNDIYFQGLATGDANRVILPEAWAKGTLRDNTVTIPMGQYMGIYGGSAIYLVGYVNSAAGDITFTYDADAETFTLNNEMFVNGKRDEVYYYSYTMPDAVISLNEPEEPVVPVLVSVPATATIEDDWTIEATFNNNAGATQVLSATEVAFDGNDVYIKGIAYYFKNAWLKGTISGNTATFASGQYVGSDDYGDEFMVGYNGSAICDIVFSYDDDAKVFTLTTPYIAENQEKDALNMWGYYNRMTIYKGEPEQPEVVEVPEGLETAIYIWTGEDVTFDDETEEPIFTEFSKQINIGFDGDDVYVQGLCTDLPEAWVKGTISGNTATFATGQYFGTDDRFAVWGITYSHYFLGFANDIQDVVFTIDPETGVFTTDTWIIDNEYADDLNFFVITSSNVWTPFVELPGKPAAPSVVSLNLNGTYPNIRLNIPTTDNEGNSMNLNKVFYRLYSDVEHEIALIPFSPEDYPYCGFEETVYEIPYTLDDDYDIYAGGEVVYLNQGADFLASLNQIGVQVVYYGGMDNPSGAPRFAPAVADNESEIIWQFIKEYSTTGINDITSSSVDSVRYINAAGISSDKPFDGINIVVTKMNDGSVVVKKVLK